MVFEFTTVITDELIKKMQDLRQRRCLLYKLKKHIKKRDKNVLIPFEI